MTSPATIPDIPPRWAGLIRLAFGLAATSMTLSLGLLAYCFGERPEASSALRALAAALGI